MDPDLTVHCWNNRGNKKLLLKIERSPKEKRDGEMRDN